MPSRSNLLLKCLDGRDTVRELMDTSITIRGVRRYGTVCSADGSSLAKPIKSTTEIPPTDTITEITTTRPNARSVITRAITGRFPA